MHTLMLLVLGLFMSAAAIPPTVPVGAPLVVIDYCQSANETLSNYCRHAVACSQNFNDLSEMIPLGLQACRDDYYKPLCPNVTIDDFNPACLPRQLSVCTAGDDCSAHSLNLFFFAEMCGMEAVKMKYGPDKVLVDRRVVYQRLFSIILENLAAFALPVVLAITACLIFHAKGKAEGTGPDGEPKTKLCGMMSAKTYGTVFGYFMALVVFVMLGIAINTAFCTLFRCWAEVHKYHKTLDFGTRCNFALAMEFIAYKHTFEVLALAAFTLADLLLVVSLSVWTVCLCCSGALASCCCQIRFFLCCVACKYFTCKCCCIMYLGQFCTLIALIAFSVALIPLMVYLAAVAGSALVMYIAIFAVLVVVFLIVTFILRTILAALTCGKVIEFTNPKGFLTEFTKTLKEEMKRAASCGVDQQDDDQNKTQIEKNANKLSHIAKWGAWTAAIPVVFLLFTCILFPLADSLMQVFAINFADVQWFYDRFQNPLASWSTFFERQWWDIAQGITDFASRVFIDWPGTVFGNVKALATTGQGGVTSAIEKNLDVTRMWWVTDWTDFKIAILVARSWTSLFEGFIVTGLAIKYGLSRHHERDLENSSSDEDMFAGMFEAGHDSDDE